MSSLPPVVDPLVTRVEHLSRMVEQLVKSAQTKPASADKPADAAPKPEKAEKTQASAKATTSKTQAKPSVATSKRSSKARTSRSGGPDDSDLDDSDGSSSSDSSQDELEGQFGAVAKAKTPDTSSGTRFVVQAMIPHDALEKFSERTPLEDRVNWWERFMYYATMAPWNEKTRIVQLRMRLPGALKDWCTQLPDVVRSDWKKLSHVFKKEWCRTIGSRLEKYYALAMRDQATPRMFLYRLNQAAKKAGIKYEKPTTDRETHIRRFIKSLSDPKLRTTLQGQRFDTMNELERTLKRFEALHQDESREARNHQQKQRPAQNLQFGRFKPPQRRAEGRAYMAGNAEVVTGPMATDT
jgi:hypothetical protein